MVVITSRITLPKNMDKPKNKSENEYKNMFNMLNCDNIFAGLIDIIITALGFSGDQRNNINISVNKIVVILIFTLPFKNISNKTTPIMNVAGNTCVKTDKTINNKNRTYFLMLT